MDPNFLIIGGQRCGTGWIAQCVREHPEVFLAQDETRFFDWHYYKGLSWWVENYFKTKTSAGAIGEKTANYLTEPAVPERIRKVLPNVKLICCIRNPVDRLRSALLLKMRNRPELKWSTLTDILHEFPCLIDRGKYATHLRRYYRLFPSDQIKVILYDDIKRNPLENIQDIYSFLNVNVCFSPPSLDVQTKAGAAENAYPMFSGLFRMLLHRRSPFRKVYSRYRSENVKFVLTKQEAIYLRGCFLSEIETLERMTRFDLRLWKNVLNVSEF